MDGNTKMTHGRSRRVRHQKSRQTGAGAGEELKKTQVNANQVANIAVQSAISAVAGKVIQNWLG